MALLIMYSLSTCKKNQENTKTTIKGLAKAPSNNQSSLCQEQRLAKWAMVTKDDLRDNQFQY